MSARIVLMLRCNKLVFLIGLVPFLAVAGAFAAPTLEDRVLECARKDSGFRRLECYDALSSSLAPHGIPREAVKPTAEPSAEPTGMATPDSEALNFSVASKREITLAGRDFHPNFVVACNAKDLSASVTLVAALPAGPVTVSTRVDTDAVVTETWAVSGDRRSIMPPKSQELLDRLRSHATFEMKIEVGKIQPLRFSFDVQDIERRMAALMRACLF